MVQQTQEQKGGVSFGQVAGAAVAGTAVGFAGNGILGNRNVNTLLGSKADLSKVSEKVSESIDTYKKIGGEIASTVSDIQEVLKDPKDFSKASIDFAKEKGNDVAKQVKDFAKELNGFSKEDLTKFVDKSNETLFGPANESLDNIQSKIKDLGKQSKEALNGISGLSGKQVAAVVGLATVATVGTMLALKPKPKVTEPTHQGMAQARSQQPQIA